MELFLYNIQASTFIYLLMMQNFAAINDFDVKLYMFSFNENGLIQ